MKLNFELPPFQRISWASSTLKLEWEPLLQLLPSTIRSLFEHPEVLQLLPLLIRTFPESDIYGEKKKLEAIGLFADTTKDFTRLTNNPFCQIAPKGHVCLLAGERQQVTSILYSEIPVLELLEQTGLPAGCLAFWHNFFSLGFTDPLWAYQFKEDGLVALQRTSNNLLNPYLIRLEIAALPYRPASLDCKVSLKLAENILKIAAEVMEPYLYTAWNEVLSWPIEWSALHGIAEIKTPLFKLIYNTDAYGEKFVTQLTSETYPDNGLNGTLFPYRLPAKMFLHDSEKYKNGIEYLADLEKITNFQNK